MIVIQLAELYGGLRENVETPYTTTRPCSDVRLFKKRCMEFTCPYRIADGEIVEITHRGESVFLKVALTGGDVRSVPIPPRRRLFDYTGEVMELERSGHGIHET